MKSRLRALLVSIPSLLWCSHTFAQAPIWLRQLGTSATDIASAMADDASGGFFVGGTTTGSFGAPSSGFRDVWLARWTSAGAPIWTRQFGTPQVDELTAAAPDCAGGVYVGGRTRGAFGGPPAGYIDAWIARHDDVGDLLWRRQLGSVVDESVNALASDDFGGVFVVGETRGQLGPHSSGSYDAWIAHYDSAGNQTWIDQFGSAKADHAYAVSPDGSGGVYVAGSTFRNLATGSAGYEDAWVARYSAFGIQLWVHQLGTDGVDIAWGVAADGVGGFYLGGSTGGNLCGPHAGGIDAWVTRFDAALNIVWSHQLGSPFDDECWTLSSDSSGGVLLGGFTYGDLSAANAGSSDAWFAQFDSSGGHHGVRQFSTPGIDRMLAIRTDPLLGAMVCGDTTGNLASTNVGQSDLWIALLPTDFASATFCTAGTTSHGCVASIRGDGVAIAGGAGNFTIAVESVEGQRLGVILYGTDNLGFAPQPWGQSSSFLCVRPPVQRTGAQSSGGVILTCSGSLVLDWNAFSFANPNALGQPFAAGQRLFAQGWFRDPTSPKGSMLSNALQFGLNP